MQTLEYPDRAPAFDNRVDRNKRDAEDIRKWLDENTGDSLPDDFKDGIARDLEKMRSESDGPQGPGGAGPGDSYYDPDAGRWRDSETGQFTTEP